MKRYIALLLAALMLLSACGTQSQSNQLTEGELPAADTVAQLVVIDLGSDPEKLREIHKAYDEAGLINYVEGFYGLASEAWDDCAIYMADNATNAFEITVFRLTEQADISSVGECLAEYKLSREGDFFGYNPEQAEIVADSAVVLDGEGRFAAVLICANADRAERAFLEAIGIEYIPEPPASETDMELEASAQPIPEASAEPSDYPNYWLKYTDPEIDDMSIYDTAPILAAWESGSDEGLNKKEKKLYQRCVELMDELIDEGMSDYEKEWAVYKWLCENVEYDWRHYEVPNSAPRDSYRPYGALVNGTAVCLGYATAFQLLMDMAGVECVTVVGAAFGSREDHAWNMVKLGNEWYCVDATWDAGGIKEYPAFCNYFNVTSDWMARSDHQWDYDAYPIATAEDGGY